MLLTILAWYVLVISVVAMAVSIGNGEYNGATRIIGTILQIIPTLLLALLYLLD